MDTEYVQENGLDYRRTTLLQFGNSWDLIGSAVLKNPGSAKAEGPITEEEASEIKSFFCQECFHMDLWQRFRPDPTMRFLEKIFNGAYVGKSNDLNGVVQLFNLTYIKEPNLELAKKKALESSSHLLFPSLDEMIPIFKDKPVYIGWFDTWKHIPKAEPIARGIFEYLSMSKNQYLEPEFEKNKYYHPIYINRTSKKEIIQISLNSFSLLLDK